MEARVFSWTDLRRIFPLAIALAALLGIFFVGEGALAGRPTATSPSSALPGDKSGTLTNDAYLEFVPGAPGNCQPPPNGGTTAVGCRFVLDLVVDAGSNLVTSQQSYLTFTYALIQNARVDQIGSSCTLTSTFTGDLGTFDAILQNETCNGPDPCVFRGLPIDPGSMAFASGALMNCEIGCGGRFRVAQVGICAVAPGQAVLHWQFSPPAPPTRNTSVGGVEDRALFHDYIINISPATPTPTSTPLVTPVYCPPGFQDVSPGDPDYQYIHCATCQTSMEAYACGSSAQEPCVPPNNYPYFRPHNPFLGNRAEFVRLIVAAERWPIDTSGGPHFTDIPPCHPYYIYVETAYNRGLVEPSPDGMFHPDTPIMRQQFAKSLVLIRNWPIDTSGGPHFSDVPTTHAFYPYIETVYNRGVMFGYPDGTFRPHNNLSSMTRAEMAGVIARAYPDCSAAPTPVVSPTCTVGPTSTGTPPTATSTYTRLPTNTPLPTSTPTTQNTPTPQCLDYLVTTGSGTPQPGGTEVPFSRCDDCTANITLPFPFSLYGTVYNSVNASSNGNLQFASSATNFTNTCLPVPAMNQAILAYWDDLRTDTGAGNGIFTATTGMAPNRQFSIIWRATYFSGPGSANFEVRLYEGQSAFDVLYGTVDDHGNSATVGAQRGTGSQFTLYECNLGGINPGLHLTFTPFTACITNTPTITRSPTNTGTPTNTYRPTYTHIPTTSGTPTSTPLVTPVYCPPGFQDVSPGDPDYQYIHCATCQTSMEAYACGSSAQEPCVPPNNYPYFRPQNPYIGTRADVCKLIVSAARWPIDTSGGPHFLDVPPCHPYYIYIETAYNRGLVSGYADDMFRPDNTMTRGAFANTLYRALTQLVTATPTPNPTPCSVSYSDVHPTDYFYLAVMYLSCRDLMHGYPDGTFRPFNGINSMTRAEMAGIIARAFPNCSTAPTPEISPTCTVGPSATPTPTCTTNYVYATATGTIVPGTTDTGNHCDDCFTTITLPFAVRFYNQSFTTAVLESNGGMNLGSIGFGGPMCPPHFEYAYGLAVNGDDLRTDLTGVCSPGPCGIYTSVSGSPPNRVFNIEWRAYYFTGAGSANFEVRLYENSPVQQVDYVYGRLDQGSGYVGVARDVAVYRCYPSGASQGLKITWTLPPCGTGTPTPIPTRAVMGHVTWDGRRPQPDPSQMLPISMTLRMKGGGPYIDYPFQVTDENGRFTEDVTGLPLGDYYWRVWGPKYLANSGVLTLVGDPVTQVEMGLMSVGDSNGDNMINIGDYNILRATFGWGCGQGGYDDRAEFTGDCQVNITDFNLLKRNFGITGAPQVRPPGGP